MTKKVQIYFGDDSELAEFEATSKGYRNDVVVVVDDIIIPLSIYSIVRLNQDYEMEVNENGRYSNEFNLFLVKELDTKSIIEELENANREKYFDNFKNKTKIDLDSMKRVH